MNPSDSPRFLVPISLPLSLLVGPCSLSPSAPPPSPRQPDGARGPMPSSTAPHSTLNFRDRMASSGAVPCPSGRREKLLPWPCPLFPPPCRHLLSGRPLVCRYLCRAGSWPYRGWAGSNHLHAGIRATRVQGAVHILRCSHLNLLSSRSVSPYPTPSRSPPPRSG